MPVRRFFGGWPDSLLRGTLVVGLWWWGGDSVLASCRRGPSDHCPLCVRVPPSAVYIVYIKDEES